MRPSYISIAALCAELSEYKEKYSSLEQAVETLQHQMAANERGHADHARNFAEQKEINAEYSRNFAEQKDINAKYSCNFAKQIAINAEQKAAMDNCAAQVSQMVAATRQTDESQREIQKAQRENENKMMLYLNEMRQTREDIRRAKENIQRAAVHNQMKPVLRVGASPQPSPRPVSCHAKDAGFKGRYRIEQ